LSLSKFYIDNKGASPEFIRNMQKYQKNLTIAQRRLSKKQYQSKNWSKERKKVALIYEKIANSRSYFNQNLIYYLVNTYDAICIEKLDMKEMIKGMNIAKSIHDVRYGDFVEKLKQKGQEYGTHIIQVSTYYPSSKLCSYCGYKNKNLELHQIEWVCSHCNTLHNRDINAANNLRNVGLKYLGLL
jgi:putative transposase